MPALALACARVAHIDARLGSSRARRSLTATSASASGDVALIRRTGTDEPTNVPGVVRRDFAVDLGGASPASVSLTFPTDADAVCLESERPLGLVFQQRLVAGGVGTEVYVDEVVPGGNAERAGAEIGDVLRLPTAVFEVSAPVDVTTWLNPPAKRKCRAYYECDEKSFDKIMDAIASHGVQIDTPSGKEDVKTVGMILERRSSRIASE